MKRTSWKRFLSSGRDCFSHQWYWYIMVLKSISRYRNIHKVALCIKCTGEILIKSVLSAVHFARVIFFSSIWAELLTRSDTIFKPGRASKMSVISCAVAKTTMRSFMGENVSQLAERLWRTTCSRASRPAAVTESCDWTEWSADYSIISIYQPPMAD